MSLDLVSRKAGRRNRKTDEKWKQEFETAGELAGKLRQAVVDAELDGLNAAFDQYESNRAQYDRLKSQKGQNKGEQSLNNSDRPNEKHSDDNSEASDDADKERDAPPSANSQSTFSQGRTVNMTSCAITGPETGTQN
jgi:hypothetical protein